MGDDVGWFNIGADHRGMMAAKTPNLDKLATQGMMFTDYYAEASSPMLKALAPQRLSPLQNSSTRMLAKHKVAASTPGRPLS
jgi:hypothetical protein